MTRTFVGRIERGEKLIERLEDFCASKNIESGWIQGLGAVEWVELCHYDTRKKEYRKPLRFEGSLEMTSLVGNVSIKDGEVFVHLHVNVSRENEKGIEVFGGHVIEAHVFACEFKICAFDEIELSREYDEHTGLHLWESEKKNTINRLDLDGKSNQESQSATNLSWAQAAELSIQQEKNDPPSFKEKRIQREQVETFKPSKDGLSFEPESLQRLRAEASWADVVQPKRGDWVSHQKFGLCRVVGKDKKGSLIIMTPEGRRKAIRLEIFKVTPPELRGEKMVFVLISQKTT